MGGINMRQFNLEEYLRKSQKKIVTRDGKSVRIICTDRKDENYPIVALVQDSTGNYEDTYHYTINGEWIKGAINPQDLLFAPEKEEGWVNLFKINSTITTGEVYNTKEEAKSAVVGSSIYISTVKVEWEE